MTESSLAEGSIASLRLDSGSNVHKTSYLYNLSERRSISKKCTLGNDLQLQATGSGVIKLLVQDQRKTVEIRIKDILRVSELPCRLLSTGAIRPHGSEFVDSRFRKSHIVLRKDGPKIELDERNGSIHHEGRSGRTMQTE